MADKLDGMSMDVKQAERSKLQSLFPQCFKEGKLDIECIAMCGYFEKLGLPSEFINDSPCFADL